MAGIFYLGGSREEPTNKNDGVFQIWPEQYYHQQPFPGTSLYFNASDESSGGSSTVMMKPRGGMSCQDCGNQAKKDCAHMRCRTCCKSRGFYCPTHVKSTWVPAAKRRDRQQQLAVLEQQKLQDLQLQVGEASRRQIESNPNDTINTGGDAAAIVCTGASRLNNAGLLMAAFPAEVTSPAVFRCMKVSTVDDSDEEYAYRTAVNIGGHVFKGVLYNQGPQSKSPQQQPGLIPTTTEALAGPSSPLYTAAQPLDAFLAGTQFFPPPRS